MTPKWTSLLPPWYYATRTLGFTLIGFGTFFDHTADRGTLILTGAGLLGVEKVVATDKSKDTQTDDKPTN